jgi:hypothetical protein
MKVMIEIDGDCITALFRQAGGTSSLRSADRSYRAMTAQRMISQLEAAIEEDPNDVLVTMTDPTAGDAIWLRLRPSFVNRMRGGLGAMDDEQRGPAPAVDL